MNSTQDILEFTQKIKSTLDAFLIALQDEKMLFESNDIERLPDVVQTKETLSNTISALYTQYMPGVTHRNAYMQECLLCLKGNQRKQVQKDWDTILKLSSQCETQNTINGMLLMASKNIHSMILDMITKRSQSQTYSKQGHLQSTIESSDRKEV